MNRLNRLAQWSEDQPGNGYQNDVLSDVASKPPLATWRIMAKSEHLFQNLEDHLVTCCPSLVGTRCVPRINFQVGTIPTVPRKDDFPADRHAVATLVILADHWRGFGSSRLFAGLQLFDRGRRCDDQLCRASLAKAVQLVKATVHLVMKMPIDESQTHGAVRLVGQGSRVKQWGCGGGFEGEVNHKRSPVGSSRQRCGVDEPNSQHSL